MKLQDVLPVLVSILVIILVAILEKQSKLLAAVTATMPLTAPLALWIVYSSTTGEKTAVTQFTLSLLVGFIPTFAFLLTIWLTSRAGLKFLPMILTGYGIWGIGAAILYLMRNIFGLE